MLTFTHLVVPFALHEGGAVEHQTAKFAAEAVSVLVDVEATAATERFGAEGKKSLQTYEHRERIKQQLAHGKNSFCNRKSHTRCRKAPF